MCRPIHCMIFILSNSFDTHTFKHSTCLSYMVLYVFNPNCVACTFLFSFHTMTITVSSVSVTIIIFKWFILYGERNYIFSLFLSHSPKHLPVFAMAWTLGRFHNNIHHTWWRQQPASSHLLLSFLYIHRLCPHLSSAFLFQLFFSIPIRLSIYSVRQGERVSITQSKPVQICWS